LSVHEVAAAKDFLLERYDVGRPGEWGRKIGVGYPPTGVWECADGPLAVAAHQRHHWQSFLAMLDNPAELSDPAYEDPLFRRDVFDLLEQLINPLMARADRLELFARGQAHGLPCAPYNTPGDFVADMQPRSREIFVTAAGTEGRAITIPWRWCWSSSPLLELRRPAPRLGQHNHEVYIEELGFTPAELRGWAEAGIV
jgi:crotonobetainyl-CoA:carnitine CoA-transferase CaiB-like acyl-CoA transferase